jgi:hypothetical protein
MNNVLTFSRIALDTPRALRQALVEARQSLEELVGVEQ